MTKKEMLILIAWYGTIATIVGLGLFMILKLDNPSFSHRFIVDMGGRLLVIYQSLESAAHPFALELMI